MSETPLVTGPRGREVLDTPPVVGVTVGALVGFTVLAGAVGVAAGVVTLVGLLAGGPLLAFVAGTVALIGVSGAFGTALIPAHLLLVAVLVAAVYDEYGRETGMLALLTVAVYVALFVVAESTLGGLTETTVVLAGLALLVSYGIHRYELLTLGLLDE